MDSRSTVERCSARVELVALFDLPLGIALKAGVFGYVSIVSVGDTAEAPVVVMSPKVVWISGVAFREGVFLIWWTLRLPRLPIPTEGVAFAVYKFVIPKVVFCFEQGNKTEIVIRYFVGFSHKAELRLVRSIAIELFPGLFLRSDSRLYCTPFDFPSSLSAEATPASSGGSIRSSNVSTGISLPSRIFLI